MRIRNTDKKDNVSENLLFGRYYGITRVIAGFRIWQLSLGLIRTGYGFSFQL
jgi:hypothetical protein